MRLERDNSQVHVVEEQPTIHTIKFTCLNQDIKTISDYDKDQLYHITRRNSHPRANSQDNY